MLKFPYLLLFILISFTLSARELNSKDKNSDSTDQHIKTVNYSEKEAPKIALGVEGGGTCVWHSVFLAIKPNPYVYYQINSPLFGETAFLGGSISYLNGNNHSLEILFHLHLAVDYDSSGIFYGIGIGYNYWPSHSGLHFRATLYTMSLYDITYKQFEEFSSLGYIIPWLGFSAAYAFKIDNN